MTPPHPIGRTEVAALGALGALWGASYLFIRVAVPDFGPFPLMATRVLLAAGLLGLLPSVRRSIPALRGHVGRLLVLGALNAAAPFSLIAAAELHISAALAAILTATVPLFSAAFSVVWSGERVSTTGAAGLLLGIVGVGLVVGWTPLPSGIATGLSAGAVLAASSCYAAAGIYAKKRLFSLSAPGLAFGQQIAAAAWLAIPAALTLPDAVPSPAALVAVGALATGSTAVAFLLYFFLIARIGATRTPSVTYLIPLFGATWGALFLHEPISAGMGAGVATVLLSVALVNGRGFRRSPGHACLRRGGGEKRRGHLGPPQH